MAQVRVHNSQLGGLGTRAHKAASLKLEMVHSVLWALYSSRHPSAATHGYCGLADVRSVAPWVGEAYGESTRLLFPEEHRAALDTCHEGWQLVSREASHDEAAHEAAAREGVLSLRSLNLEAGGAGAGGQPQWQPLNLEALIEGGRRAEARKEHEGLRGNDGNDGNGVEGAL